MWLLAAVDLFVHCVNVRLELLLQRRPLQLEGWRHQSILYRELIRHQIQGLDHLKTL